MKINGVSQAAELLSELDLESREKFMAVLRENDPELAKQVEKEILDFDELLNLDEKDFKRLLSEISMTDWAIALKLASPVMKIVIIKRLPKRARENLDEAISMVGLKKKSEVYEVQKKIFRKADEMIEKSIIKSYRATKDGAG